MPDQDNNRGTPKRYFAKRADENIVYFWTGQRWSWSRDDVAYFPSIIEVHRSTMAAGNIFAYLVYQELVPDEKDVNDLANTEPQ